MRVLKIVCDRCGKEINCASIQIVPYVRDIDTGDLVEYQPYESKYKKNDYCEECMNSIMEFATNAEQIQVKKESVKKNKYKKIDIEKILEMKNKGMTNKEIGEKIGISGNAVAVRICSYKKKKEELNQVVKEEVKKEVDCGKAFALHRAGWTIKDIADELRVTEDEASDAIKKGCEKSWSDEE